MERTVEKLKRVLVESLDKRYAFSLYTSKYQLLDHPVEYINRFGTLPDFDGILCEHFIVYIKHTFTRTLQRRRTQMMEQVNEIRESTRGHIHTRKRRLIELWDKKMEEVQTLKVVGRILYEMGIMITMKIMRQAAHTIA